MRIPVATGERLTTKAEFATLLRTGGASILQPALGRAGGIWEMKKVAAMAEAFNAQMAPHLYAGPVEWAANIALSVSIPNLLIAETIETPFHDALIKGTIRVEDGYITGPRPHPAWASRSTRRWPAPIPIPAPACTWKCSRTRSTTATATFSKAARRCPPSDRMRPKHGAGTAERRRARPIATYSPQFAGLLKGLKIT